MKTQTFKRALPTIFGGLLASALCLSGPVNAQVSEVEPNDTSASAQALSITGGSVTTVANMEVDSAMITTDDDLYSFDAVAGDVPTIMVVSDGNWDPILVLYREDGELLVQNADAALTPNPGSTSTLDPRIDLHRIDVSGRYYVGVTAESRSFTANFLATTPSLQAIGGAYQLQISGVSAAPGEDPVPDPGPVVTEDGALVVGMQVRRWEGRDKHVSKRWKKRMRRMGKRNGIYPVPVAILSSDDFEATTVDKKSLKFGATGEENSLFRCSKRARDVNRDGRKDLICFFDAFKTDFQDGDVEGFLNGKTREGQAIKASAALKEFRIPHKKRGNWNKRHHRGHHAHKRYKGHRYHHANKHHAQKRHRGHRNHRRND